jgi:hypothetical protein
MRQRLAVRVREQEREQEQEEKNVISAAFYVTLRLLASDFRTQYGLEGIGGGGTRPEYIYKHVHTTRK